MTGRAVAGLALVLLGAAAGCRDGGAGGGPAGRSGDDSPVVARIDGQAITLAELEARLRQRAPYVQARYATPERRKELLENLVRFEVLAREARRRGYDRDPVVLRQRKQELVDRMIAEELDGKLAAEAVPEEELRRTYQERRELFTQAEAVRVSQILLRDRAAAERVAARARALAPGDQAGFRQLVAAHSQDEDSRQREGDLTFLERDSPEQPRAVVEAAFTLGQLGEVAGPVESDRGFHVLRLTQRRAGFLRPFEQVKNQVLLLVQQERRARRLDEWVADMRKQVNIQVYEDELRQLAAKQGLEQEPGPSPERAP